MNTEIRDYIGIPAQTLTSSFVTVIPRSANVEYIALNNTNTTDALVTIQDGNGQVFYNQAAGAPAGQLTTIALPEGGLLFSGGLQWKSDTTGVTGWLRARYS